MGVIVDFLRAGRQQPELRDRFTILVMINQSINQHTILTCTQKQTSIQLSLPHGTVN